MRICIAYITLAAITAAIYGAHALQAVADTEGIHDARAAQCGWMLAWVISSVWLYCLGKAVGTAQRRQIEPVDTFDAFDLSVLTTIGFLLGSIGVQWIAYVPDRVLTPPMATIVIYASGLAVYMRKRHRTKP